jgi:large subunit ribosomal protein L6
MSRIGKKPVAIPKDAKAEFRDGRIFIEGPKGKDDLAISYRIEVEIKDGQVLLRRAVDTKQDRALHGLYRSLILNMLKGVTEGYTKELEIQGIGFKAQVQGSNLNMQLGFSHPVNFPIPEGIKIETPKPTQIVVRGIDKQLVGKIASELRAICPPEPYKGKGIRYLGEYIKKKVGKAQATGGGGK